MNIKEKKDFIEWGEAVIQKWVDVLQLGKPSVDLIEKESADYLETKMTYPYTSIVIFFNPKFREHWKDEEKSGCERYLLHEVCHTLTDPLIVKANKRFLCQDELLDERELLTDKITNIVWNEYHNL